MAAVCMMIFIVSVCQIASKSFALALCSVESRTIPMANLGIDIGLALVIKVVRHDFMYWPPIESFFSRFMASFIVLLKRQSLILRASCRYAIHLSSAVFTLQPYF